MQDLALQVGQIHRIAIGQHQSANPCRREIHGGWRRARLPRPPARGQPRWRPALDTDLGQKNMARIAQQLIVVHGKRKKLKRAGTRPPAGSPPKLFEFAQIGRRIVVIAVGMVGVRLDINSWDCLIKPLGRPQVVHLGIFDVINQRPVKG